MVQFEVSLHTTGAKWREDLIRRPKAQSGSFACRFASSLNRGTGNTETPQSGVASASSPCGISSYNLSIHAAHAGPVTQPDQLAPS